MYRKCFLLQFKNQYVKIRDNYELISKSYDPENIHDMRVTIKRLRAFFQLTEALNADFKLKPNFRKVKRLFKAAGKIRDAQVQYMLTEEWERRLNTQFPEYKHQLLQQETVAKADFILFTEHFDIQKLEKKAIKIDRVLADIANNLAQSRANAWIDALFDKLRTLKLIDGANPETLHDIRTVAKQARYTLEILQECLPALRHSVKTIQQLKHIHQILGKWHDLHIGLGMLNGFRNNLKRQCLSQSNEIEQLDVSIGREMMVYLQKFERKWSDFMRLISAESR